MFSPFAPQRYAADAKNLAAHIEMRLFLLYNKTVCKQISKNGVIICR